MLRIATWNVNSLRVRLELLGPWLTQDGPDVVCLQETKVTDDRFPIQALVDLGYQVVFTGQKTYNGVALLSRRPITDVVLALPGAPLEDEKRFIAATIAGVRVINVYVPNGQAVGAPKFFYKLAWLQALQTFVATAYTPEDTVLLCGDFNIAPEARDVYDASQAEGEFCFILTSVPLSHDCSRGGCAIPSVCIARKAGCIAGGITGPWRSSAISVFVLTTSW